MRAFWLQSNNVGDILTPFILQRLFNKTVRCDTRRGGRWLMSGSILHYEKGGDILCGVGSFHDAKGSGGGEVLALRGPRTAELRNVRNCVFGDAGLILPSIYTPTPVAGHPLGIVPHYIDAHNVSGENVIPVSLSVSDFIDRVTSCKVIASSSLHGIVIAEAYGIPAIRLRFPSSEYIRDFDYKHADYYEGTGRTLPDAYTLEAVLAGDVPTPVAPDLKEVTERLTRIARYYTV